MLRNKFINDLFCIGKSMSGTSEIESIAHRTAWRYIHDDNPKERLYSFNFECLLQFAEEIIKRERNACAALVQGNADVCANNSILRDVLQGNATAIRARGSND